MKKSIKYFFVLSILVFVSCSSEDDASLAESSEDPLNAISVTEEILRLVNIHRESLGLSALEKNQTAEQMSIDHTNYMISIADINHNNFGERSSVLREQENATAAAENVANFYPDAASVVNGWLESTGHRENIEGNYTYTGIAAIKDSNGRYYYTQIFFR